MYDERKHLTIMDSLNLIYVFYVKISYADLTTVAKSMGIKNAKQIVEQVIEIISNWRKYASDSGVNRLHTDQIEKNLRLMHHSIG